MKILIPVDGSDQANAALESLASHSTFIGQAPEVRLLDLQPALSVRVSRAIGREEANAFRRAQADDVLRSAVTRLKDAGIPVRASDVLGSRSDAIGAVAVRGRTDLIVWVLAAIRDARDFFGSITNTVLVGCSKPLLMLRSAKMPQRGSLAVGIAADGTRSARHPFVNWAAGAMRAAARCDKLLLPVREQQSTSRN